MTSQNIPLTFNFTTNNFAVPRYKDLSTKENITYANESYEDTYSSQWESGWSGRSVRNTDMMSITNYYYKQNSPTKVWFGMALHVKTGTVGLVPHFSYALVEGSQTVTLKNDNGDDITQTVNKAAVSGSKVAAVSASIDSPSSGTIYYICAAKI